MSTTNFPGITIYRNTLNNSQISLSNSGEGTPNDEIPIPAILTGTLSGISGAVVTGIGTDFSIEVQVGENLYYININGTPILVGKILTVDSATQITLTANASFSPAGGSTLAASQKFTGTQEIFWARVPTVVINASTKAIPDLALLRQPDMLNVAQFCKLSRTSVQGQPLTNAAFVNVPFTLRCQQQFSAGTLPGRTFSISSQLPNFIWIQINPVIGQSNRLFQSTQWLHDWEENLPSINVTPNMANNTLINAGYEVTNVVSGGGTGNPN